jgi:hypothetical protein
MNRESLREKWIPLALFHAAIVLLTAVVWFWIPDAHADGVLTPDEQAYADAYSAAAICPVLAEYPTEAGVMGVMVGIHQSGGFTFDDSADVINYAVATWCPELFPLLQQIGDRARASEKGMRV